MALNYKPTHTVRSVRSDNKRHSRNHMSRTKSPKRLKSMTLRLAFCSRRLKIVNTRRATILNATISIRTHTRRQKKSNKSVIYDPALCVYLCDDSKTKTHAYDENKTITIVLECRFFQLWRHIRHAFQRIRRSISQALFYVASAFVPCNFST